MPKHKGQRRREARERKYTMGIDLGAGDSQSFYVAGFSEGGVYRVTDTGAITAIKEHPSTLSRDEFRDFVARTLGQPVVIEGESVPVETRPEHLLDAGGSEP